MKKVWFITGASTGFGRALAEELLKRNYIVVLTARKPETVMDLCQKYPESTQVIKLDVTCASDIVHSVDSAISKWGKIDVLVNNAGYGIVGAVEEVSESEMLRVFNTNVFGLINLTKAVLPHMRKARSGHIINLSSIAGLVSTPGFGIYNATKFAVEGMSEALAQEVKCFGIKVTIIEPGPFRTDFANRSLAVMPEMPEYDEAMIVTRNYIQKVDGNQPGDPVKGAKLMIKLTEIDNPPLRIPLGKMALDRWNGKLEVFSRDLKEWHQEIINCDF